MHEAALAAPLVRLVLEETARHGQEQGQKLRVTRVRVRAGLLMGVEAPTLQGIFALMAEGTAAQDAELVLEAEPMRGSCPDCGAQDFTTRSREFRCPECRGENADWTGGNELYIASIEVKPIPN
ncbi:MAG: hydrogenase maturation nickel metallochaperone HypA [Desulfovibrionaceae bacterium]|nr:hydrogenase maturation nickel metallochaperone HypA [Desulfovibrionaceae bacterium]